MGSYLKWYRVNSKAQFDYCMHTLFANILLEVIIDGHVPGIYPISYPKLPISRNHKNTKNTQMSV